MKKTGIGIVGCGKISDIYLKNLCHLFADVEVRACADLNREAARAKAAQYGGIPVMTVDELMSNPNIDIVLNLTIPAAHYEVAMQAVTSGKSVHSEKPLTLTREEGGALLAAAEKNGVRVGCAPDTFLGGGIQTSIKLIDGGAIGTPIGAQAFMLSHGPEAWHPNPEFYYKVGGGPMFDMGPYYLTALIAMLGPVKRVTGATRVSMPERIATCKEKNGLVIKVDVPTHVTGLLDFDSGAIGTIATSFDVWASAVPRIEIFGTEGTLSVPDPNTFGGPVRIKRMNAAEWEDIPIRHGYTEGSRGIGPADMAAAMSTGRAHRASGELAYHVLDIMHAIHEASEQGKHIEVKSRCARPQPLPEDLVPGQLD